MTKEKPQAEFRVLPLFWKNEQDSADVIPTSKFANGPNVPFGSTPFRAAFDVYRQIFADNFFVHAANHESDVELSNVPDGRSVRWGDPSA